MLDSATQSLENELFLTISGNRTMFLFDYASLACNEAELLQLIKQTCKITNRHQYHLNGAILNEAYLLSLLDDSASFSSADKSMSDRNNTIYRQLCSLVRDLGERVIVIRRAHRLSKPAVQLLSRLAKYAKRTGSNWKFFLLTNGPRIDPISLRLLAIDQFFPNAEIDTDAPLVTTVGPTTARPATSILATDKAFWHLNSRAVISATILMLMAVLAFWAIFQSNPNGSESSDRAASLTKDQQTLTQPTDVVVPIDQREPPASSTYLSDSEFQQKLVAITRVSEVSNGEDALSDEPLQSIVQADMRGVDAESELPKEQAIEPRLLEAIPFEPMSSELSQALQSSNVAKIASLVLSGESLQSVNERGETPLIYAINSNDSHLLNSLLAMNAEVDFVDKYGRSALFYACIEGRTATIQALLNAGADANRQSLQLKTPLMAAIHNGNASAAMLLIKNGANVDTQDRSGWTALFHSAWNDNLELSKLLVDQGSVLSVVDSSGYTAAQVAQFRGSGAVASYLAGLSDLSDR